VVGVDWYDAYAFARWADKRLLRDDEFERAARGTGGQLYPWGDEFDSAKCHCGEGGALTTASVGSYGRGKSREDVLDLVGNAAEWTGSRRAVGMTADGTEVGWPLVMGGAWNETCEVYGLGFFRRPADPLIRSEGIGFRCARDAGGDQPAGMALIPAGEFIRGAGYGSVTLELARSEQVDGLDIADLIGEAPSEHAVRAFAIDVQEVTNAEYRRFLGALKEVPGHRWCHPEEPPNKSHRPAFWEDAGLSADDQPVVGVDWWDAYGYASWAGKRLPTTLEWEKAARGTDGRLYPTGDDFDPSLCRTMESSVDAPSSPGDQDKSFYGVLAMTGNVREWTQTRRNERAVVKGASCQKPGRAYGLVFVSPLEDLTSRARDLGFRCVEALAEPE